MSVVLSNQVRAGHSGVLSLNLCLLRKPHFTVEVIGNGVDEAESDDGLEVMWVKLSRRRQADVLVGIVYVTPQGLSKLTVKGEGMVDFILDHRRLGMEVLIMGDFNAHFDNGGRAIDCRAKFLSRISEVGGLRIMNFEHCTRGKWTWHGRGKRSVLDYVLMTQGMADRTTQVTVDDDGWFDIGSDHNLIFWETLGEREDDSGVDMGTSRRRRENNIWTWKMKGDVDWAAYKVRVEEKMDLFDEEMLSDRGWTAKDRYCVFLNYLQEAAEVSFKKVFIGGHSQGRQQNTWWDEEVKEAIKRRKEACRVHRKYDRLSKAFPNAIPTSLVEEKWVQYMEEKQNAKELVRKKRQKERDEVLEEFRKTRGYGGSFFWNKVKKSTARGIRHLRDPHGKLIAEEKGMAEIARLHFEKNGRQTAEIREEETDQRELLCEVLDNEQVESLEEPLSYEEVERAVKGMKKGKGVGIDKISSEMLLGGGKVLWRRLTAILNACWEEEYIPADWMEGIVIPLHKGGDSKDIGNYREITLGSHVGKVFCAVLNARLAKVMESSILREAQGGFRKNRRTTDQIFVVNGIGQARRSQGKKTWMAFLDFKKAFPSVWREGLWRKMKRYGIDGKFLRVCENLYRDVGAKVRVGRVFSERFDIKEGLRQGCILSPSLFSLFLMDLAEELEEKDLGVKVSGVWMGACFFADDIVLLGDSENELQRMLGVVSEYAQRWKLRFNASKCGVLVVGQKKRDKLWRLGGEEIKEVDEYKYLGVWINRQVTGHNHVRHLEEKALGLQHLARGAKFWRIDEDIKAGLTTWEVVCKPVLNYGAEVWACASNADEHRVEVIQNRAGRRILGLSWRFPSVVVRGELGWRKLKFDRHRLALEYLGRLRGMGADRWPRIVAEALHGLRGSGTWVDYVSALVVKYQLQEDWAVSRWEGKVWKRRIAEQVVAESQHAWREEVESRGDLGMYGDRQLELGRASYMGNISGDKIREEIKQKCEWGEHFFS